MIQGKFSLDEEQARFVNRHGKYGFKDKSSLVRAALARFQEQLDRERLELSADLYAEVYEADSDLKDLTESALAGWPE